MEFIDEAPWSGRYRVLAVDNSFPGQEGTPLLIIEYGHRTLHFHHEYFKEPEEDDITNTTNSKQFWIV